MEVAVFAGGCFWGVEAVFEHVRGVKQAVSGYAGGDRLTATYPLVGTGGTGHAESVKVVYDPRQVSYGQLLKVFFSVAHDPTQLDRQGPDRGPQYRSQVFATSKAQQAAARAYIARLDAAGVFDRPIVTRVEPLRGFYPAIVALLLFNRLVRLRNLVRNAWADIDVQLQRRHDLVPQLVAAVKGYAGHEHALLAAVTELRARAMANPEPARLGAIEGSLQSALGKLVLLAEAYPDLKASDNFLQLQRDLVDVEDHLQYARRFYNGAVRDFNDATQRFPDLLVARGFGFEAAEFFETDDASRAAVDVELAR